MRPLLFAISAVFLLAGAVGLTRPKATVVSHQAYRYSPGTMEPLTKEGSVVYAGISLGLGCIAFVAALSWRKWHAEEKRPGNRWP